MFYLLLKIMKRIIEVELLTLSSIPFTAVKNYDYKLFSTSAHMSENQL